MGCCASNNLYPLFDKLDSKLFTESGAATFDDFMKSAGETIESIEKIRKIVTEPYGKLLCQSGAIVLQKPGLLSCLYGLIYQAARDVGSDVDAVIKVTTSSPYVDIDAKKGTPTEVKNTGEAFVELVKSLEPVAKECEELYKKVEELVTKCNDGIMTWTEEFKKLSDDFFKLKETVEKAYDNGKKIAQAMNCMKDILGLITSLVSDSATLYNKLVKDKEELSKMYELAKKIHGDKDKEIKGNRHLYWKYTGEVKHATWEDLQKIWKKVTGEEYSEKPVKIEKKPETKKEDKKEEKKEEKKDDKKDDHKKDDKKDEKKDKKDGKKYSELQNQIDELKKLVEDLRGRGGSHTVSNIFVHKPTPLKNWNLSLRNSFDIGNGNYAKSIAVNYEQDIVVFGTKDGSILSYKLSTWEKVHASKPHTGTVKSITYLFDGKHVISGGNDGKIVKTDVTTHSSKESSHVLPGAIKSVAYAMDGANLYAACGRVLYHYEINNLSGNYEHKVFDFDDELVRIAYIKENKHLAIGFRNGTVRLFCPEGKKTIKEWRDHSGKRITDLTVCRYNGAHALATSAKDMTIHVYDLDEKVLKASTKVATSKTNTHANSLIYGHDEKTLFTIHDDGKIILNQYQNSSLDKEQTHKHLISNAAKLSAGFYVGDGSTFIVALQPEHQGGNGKIEVYGSK